MIKTEGLTYGEALKRIDSLRLDLEDAREELEGIEEKQNELEGEVYNLESDINRILDSFPRLKELNDLTEYLPTELFQRGYKLTCFVESVKIPLGLFTEGGIGAKVGTLLTSPSGDVIKEWAGTPCLGDLFEQI